MKCCRKCHKEQHETEFYTDRRNCDGLQSNCKSCQRALTNSWRERNLDKAKANSLQSAKNWYLRNKESAKKRIKEWRNRNKGATRAAIQKCKLKRTFRYVPWADNKSIKLIYDKCAELNNSFGAVKYEVDHIVPLNGKHVCGLHVHHNLQILPAKVNREKSNRFLVTA